MDDAWGTIDDIVAWLDASSVLPLETEKLLRIMKLTEEAGEVAQAVIDTMGQNPRKGVTRTWDDVHAELCDVILTAMVALTTLTPDAPEIFNVHLARVANRSLRGPHNATATSKRSRCWAGMELVLLCATAVPVAIGLEPPARCSLRACSDAPVRAGRTRYSRHFSSEGYGTAPHVIAFL